MLRAIHLTSLAELRANEAAWDDLWLRSDVSMPMARAELVAQWAEQFAPNADFHAVVVEEDGTWVAALPLVGVSRFPLVDAGTLLGNSWSPAGTLLHDPLRQVDPALDLLVAQLAESRWNLLWLDSVPLDSPAWQALHAAVGRAGMASSAVERCQVARFGVDDDWEAFSRRRSKNFREQMARSARQLAELGEVAYEAQLVFNPDAVEGLLCRGFEVEHRSWKGQANTSVLGSGMFPFFLRQARQLARWKQLQLMFLTSSGRSIAFAYCMVAKGVCHIWKIGYDEQYAKYRPGYLLVGELYRQLWLDPCMRAVDWLAATAEYQLRWKPTTYRVGRVVVAPRGVLGRAIVHAHRHWLPAARRLRRRLSRK